MTYLFGLGDPVSGKEETKWGRLTAPRRPAPWEITNRAEITTVLDKTKTPLVLPSAGEEVHPISNRSIVEILSRTYPYHTRDFKWKGPVEKEVYEIFWAPIRRLFMIWLEPIPAGYKPTGNLEVTLGRLFFEMLLEVVDLPGNLFFFNGDVKLTDDSAKRILETAEVRQVFLSKSPHFEGVLKDVAFVPVYTTRAETTSSIISVALGDGDLQFAVEPRTLKDNLRDDGPDPTQIVWTITPMDIFAPIVTAQGDRVRLDLTTTSSIVASLGGVHTSAFKKVAVQAICVRCNVPYNVGEEGNYDCQWGIQAKMIYRDYPYNATITYRGRHNHATRYPDKLADIAHLGDKIASTALYAWRDFPSVLIDNALAGTMGEIRRAYHEAIHTGTQLMDISHFEVSNEGVEAKYGQSTPTADYLMQLEKLYNDMLFLKPVPLKTFQVQ